MTDLHHHDTIQTQEFDLEFYHNLLGIEWDCQDDHAEATDAAYPNPNPNLFVHYR